MGCQCLASKAETVSNNDFNVDNATKFDSKKASENDMAMLHKPFIDEREYQIPTNKCRGNNENDTLQLLRMALFKEINNVRKSPWTYIDKVVQYKNRIVLNNNQPYLKVNDKININLHKGHSTFDCCISFLSKKASKPPLILLDELTLPFPITNPESCVTQEYLMKIITQKNFELKNKDIEIVNFHYDKSIKDYEFSTIMQIVDDTNSHNQRRMNIFSANAKYIGITCGLIEESLFCFYFLFAKDKSK